jgi:hypothetical protein
MFLLISFLFIFPDTVLTNVMTNRFLKHSAECVAFIAWKKLTSIFVFGFPCGISTRNLTGLSKHKKYFEVNKLRLLQISILSQPY